MVKDLVNKDTDGDGVLDWEESLWGTDPNKKETTPGTSDSVAISKLRTAQGTNEEGGPLSEENPEKLTETDKFSRELFSTVAALNQSGAMDQATAEKLTNSLAERIQSSTPRTIYILSDIKISKEDNLEAANDYNNAFSKISQKSQVNYTTADVLRKFIIDENNVDSSVLSKLTPIIEQTNITKDAMLAMSVPQSLSELHLNVINSMERLIENLKDLQLYDTDVIISLSAMTQYEQNTTTLGDDINNLINAVQKIE